MACRAEGTSWVAKKARASSSSRLVVKDPRPSTTRRSIRGASPRRAWNVPQRSRSRSQNEVAAARLPSSVPAKEARSWSGTSSPNGISTDCPTGPGASKSATPIR